MESVFHNKKAEGFIEEAEKKLNSWSLFTSKALKREEAAELYQSAANQYKTGGNWKKAGDTYLKAGDLYKKGSGHEAANCYVDAGKMLKKVSADEALKAFNLAIEIYTDSNRHSGAARLCKEVGEIFEKDGKYAQSAKAFKQASHFYTASDQPTNAMHQLVKVADLLVQASPPVYEEAIEHFEKVSRYSLDNRMLRYSVKGYLFKAGLCSMALAIAKDDYKTLQDTIEKYVDMDPDFESSAECKFLQTAAPIVEEGNDKDFQAAVKALNKKKKLDDWQVNILLSIKRNLKQQVQTDEIDIT